MVFDRWDDHTNVYTVDVLNTRTTFQINREFALRAIVQYDSSKKQVLTDFLGSWELLPGTVAYAGYGSLIEQHGWNGSEWTDNSPLSYRMSQRGFFFKASYIHRFSRASTRMDPSTSLDGTPFQFAGREFSQCPMRLSGA